MSKKLFYPRAYITSDDLLACAKSENPELFKKAIGFVPIFASESDGQEIWGSDQKFYELEEDKKRDAN